MKFPVLQPREAQHKGGRRGFFLMAVFGQPMQADARARGSLDQLVLRKLRNSQQKVQACLLAADA